MSGKIKAQADSLAPQALFVGQKDMEGDRAEAEEESEERKDNTREPGSWQAKQSVAGH